jgi:hypothetical protein
VDNKEKGQQSGHLLFIQEAALELLTV